MPKNEEAASTTSKKTIVKPKVGKNKKKKKKADDRFSAMRNDPRFLPVDGRRMVKDPNRFKQMFSEDFPMLVDQSNDARKQKTELTMRNMLKGMYKIRETASEKRAKELLKEQEEMEKEEVDSSEEEEDAPEKSTREELFGEDEDEGVEEQDEERKLTFDEFLERVKHLPGYNAGAEDDDDDVLDFQQPEEEYEVDEEALAQEMARNDIWAKHLELIDEKAAEAEVSLGDETNRLAVTNCDWSIITSQDLYVMFKTMCPTFGQIRSVTIYLSDYGKKQIEKEEKYGPDAVWYSEEEYKRRKQEKIEFAQEEMEKKRERLITSEEIKLAGKRKHKKKPEAVLKSASEEADVFDPEKVREYEFNKMKYYFAIVVCDSKETANHLYESCEGREIESTSICLDLRFVPNDTSFEGRAILNRCDSLPENYKPKQNIQSKALNAADVKFSWDTNDADRRVLLSKNFDETSITDLQKFIASDSDSDSDSDNEEAQQRKEELKKLKKQQKKLEALREKLEGVENPDTIKLEKINKLEKKVLHKIKKLKKQKKQKSAKEDRKKYKQLLQMAKIDHERESGQDYDSTQNLEITFDTELEEKQKELAQITKEKQLQKDESWWETLERKRKMKLKDKKKSRKQQIKEAAEGGASDNEDSSSDADLAAEDATLDDNMDERKYVKREKKKKEQENKKRTQLEMLMSDYQAKEAFNIKKDKAREVTRRVMDEDELPASKSSSFSALEDPRFMQLLIEDPDMNLDPTHAKFQKTNLIKKISDERRKYNLTAQEKKEKEARKNLIKGQKRKNASSDVPAAKKQKTQ